MVLASAAYWLTGGFGFLAAVAGLWWWANRRGVEGLAGDTVSSNVSRSTAMTSDVGGDLSLEEALAKVEALTVALEQEKERATKVEAELRGALESSLLKQLESDRDELIRAHDVFVEELSPLANAMTRFKELVDHGETSWAKLRGILDALELGADPRKVDPTVLKVRVPVTRDELVAPLDGRDKKVVLGELRKALHPDHWTNLQCAWVTQLFEEVTKRLNSNLNAEAEDG